MPLTQQQTNILIGSLLGDGHLERRKSTHNTSLQIMRAKNDEEYLKYQFSIFKNLCGKKEISHKSYLDKRTNKTYSSVYFRTKRLQELNSFYDGWYQNKTKIVPKNLVLNPEIIAIWFADDGSIRKIQNRYEITLATNSFSKQEVLFLIDKLYSIYKENFYPCKQKTGFVISCSGRASKLIMKDIEPFLFLTRKKIW